MDHEKAAERFYRHVWPHRATVLRTARFLTRSAAEADDLAQETFMRAFRNIDRFDATGNVKGWLTAILRHVHIDRGRVRGTAVLSGAAPLDDAAVAAREPVHEIDPRDVEAQLEQFSDQAVIDALHALPDEIRWTLLLVDVQQMAYEDAATVLEVPEGTVKSRVFRGRRLLRDMLTWRGEAGAGGGGDSTQHPIIPGRAPVGGIDGIA